MAELNLKNINKVYPNGVQAVFDFNLDIKDKEFIVLVGPSGCGKSTTLRMIAGLEDISSGELYIDGELMNDVAPANRQIAMVFQSYALYPHMTVYDNMAFGLKIRHVKKQEIEERVQSAAHILGLEPYLDRKPKALSGGQRQRVALGRAIVRDAKVFLMDEPLSNLDAKLRVQMRSELIKLHRRLNATTIYVTHDQIEAMTMASRIVIMKDGYVQQVGTPKEVYDFPANMFVGGFIGTPPMNFINGTVLENGHFTNAAMDIVIPEEKLAYIKEADLIGKEVVLGVRPENMKVKPEDVKKNKDSKLTVTVDVSEMLGANTNIYTDINEASCCIAVADRIEVNSGDQLEIAFEMDKCHFFDVESTKCVTSPLLKNTEEKAEEPAVEETVAEEATQEEVKE